ncbi:MAG: putative oxidoreductase C-terminal domain-containing protein [Opitutaceae bacterium]|nr:putative oxidoreductase C-terminal domain-containing protein [Opitutaceae bacterium]
MTMAIATSLLCAAPDRAGSAGRDAVRLITLDPGHFHAALFQKEMRPEISRRVHVYAPCGPDLLAHLNRVAAFNARTENPTTWELEVHASPDFLPRLLAERPGNVVVVSGANRDKIKRLEAIIAADLHTLADKPWIIEPGELPALERTLRLARRNRVAAYDAMTQRYEITCQLQKELVNDPAVFGSLVNGTAAQPAVYMESVHFLKKEVAGAPLLRPAWFFDAREQGEPLADVGTHLVDLVQWMLSPEKSVDYRRDIALLRGSREMLHLTREQFRSVTGLADFPASLAHSVRDGRLEYVAENRVNYTLCSTHVKLDVRWEFEPPPGGKDTELAVFRGSRSRVEVRQGREQNFVPEVYVVANRSAERAAIAAALRQRLQRLATAPGEFGLRESGDEFHVVIPPRQRVSHEAHFALLVGQFLTYQQQPDTLPSWETDFMLAKYFVTTEGVRLGRLPPAGQRAAMAK